MSRASFKGTGCQAVRPERARLRSSATPNELLCGQPSRFMWFGFDPRHFRMTLAERKRHIRTQILICADCAKELLHDFGWQIKDGKARLERLDVVKFRAHCRSCGINTWVAWDTEAPQTYPGGPFMFCPRCGERATYAMDHELDYWEVMSEDLSEAGVNFPIQLLKMLYEEWPRTDRRFYRFFDYVRFQMELFERTGDIEVAT